jgi:hypothetical protein
MSRRFGRLHQSFFIWTKNILIDFIQPNKSELSAKSARKKNQLYE